ncbi:MAG: hypothetical protein K2M17_03760, partial [Bacilli bacterium]|nr:hypothetical protein [Bacilli bacterium]
MSTTIQILRGKEIKDAKAQERMETIHNSWLNIENPPFEGENIVFDTACGKDEYCVLGSDWVLFYTLDFEAVERKVLHIEFFEAMQNSENYFRRSVEMLMTLKMLARKYKDFLIEAYANKFSFPFYELFLRKGLITKFYEEAPN